MEGSGEEPAANERYHRGMERDPAEDEIHEILRQQMGCEAQRVVGAWLDRYKQAALDAAAAGQTREQREVMVRQVRQRLLGLLQAELPGLIARERECEEAIREAGKRARRVYEERFEREVATTLDDPAFARPVAERVADAELHTFRRDLLAEVAELVRYHRDRLRVVVDRLLSEWE